MIGEAIASPMRWPSMWIPTLASANKGTITKLVHGCSRYCSRSLGEIAERHQRDMVGVEGRDHYERDEVVDDRHRQEPHAPARAIRCDQREHPSTNAVSVDIAAAHPCAPSPPALHAR